MQDIQEIPQTLPLPVFQPKHSVISELLDEHQTIDGVLTHLYQKIQTEPVDARLMLQVFLNVIGRESESFQVSHELLKLAPRDPRVLFNHGWHQLKRGNLQTGMSLLEFGRQLRNYGNPPLNSSRPLWMPNKGHDQRVHLALEGGLGDEIIFFRFGKDLAEKYNCHVNVICHPSLASVFAQQPWVSAVIQKEAAPGVYHDSWLPGMSSAFALGYEFKDISGKPYLQIQESKIQEWKNILNGIGGENKKIKIGIRWAGNPKFEHQQFREFPPEILISLSQLKIPGIEFQLYSFQRDANLLPLPPQVTDLAPQLKTWDDTAAALKNMDLVISSCTSIAHMSGALGVPTWVLVPALPYFVWALDGDTSPWYDSVRLFRQKCFGEWADVRRDIHSSLAQFLRAQSSSSAKRPN